MAPFRKKGARVATVSNCVWSVGDLVLAKVKGHPWWPAKVSEPEKFGQPKDHRKVFVSFFGTQQIGSVQPVDVKAFTADIKKILVEKTSLKSTISDFSRAVKEICEADKELTFGKSVGSRKSEQRLSVETNEFTLSDVDHKKIKEDEDDDMLKEALTELKEGQSFDNSNGCVRKAFEDLEEVHSNRKRKKTVANVDGSKNFTPPNMKDLADEASLRLSSSDSVFSRNKMSPQQCWESNSHKLTFGESEVLKDYKEPRKGEAEEDQPSNEPETQDQSTIVGYRRLKKASPPLQKQSQLSSQVTGSTGHTLKADCKSKDISLHCSVKKQGPASLSSSKNSVKSTIGKPLEINSPTSFDLKRNKGLAFDRSNILSPCSDDKSKYYSQRDSSLPPKAEKYRVRNTADGEAMLSPPNRRLGALSWMNSCSSEMLSTRKIENVKSNQIKTYQNLKEEKEHSHTKQELDILKSERKLSMGGSEVNVKHYNEAAISVKRSETGKFMETRINYTEDYDRKHKFKSKNAHHRDGNFQELVHGITQTHQDQAVKQSIVNHSSTTGVMSDMKPTINSINDSGVRCQSLKSDASKVQSESNTNNVRAAVEAAKEKQRRLAETSKVLEMNKASTEVVFSASTKATPCRGSPAHGQAQNSRGFSHVPHDASGETLGNMVNGIAATSEIREDQNRDFIVAEDQMEALMARDTFQGMLETLSRAKDSIARATRHALDCARLGIVDQVIDIIVQRLENEKSLSHRLNLFYLVDSITQISRNMQVYRASVEGSLSRILHAVAPQESCAQENRLQCLKVLHIWIDRKVMDESVLRGYVNELESQQIDDKVDDITLRRPARFERALDDPIREMEGMCVDEYGSNATFGLNGFLSSCMLEDGVDSPGVRKQGEGLFSIGTTITEAGRPLEGTPDKQSHILEDVDGELEMEDACPDPTRRTDSVEKGLMHDDAPLPPLPPEDPPTSPPPLPSSPPPPLPLSPPPLSPLSPPPLPSAPFPSFVVPVASSFGNSTPSEFSPTMEAHSFVNNFMCREQENAKSAIANFHRHNITDGKSYMHEYSQQHYHPVQDILPFHKNPSHNSPGKCVSQLHYSHSDLHNTLQSHQTYQGVVHYQPPYPHIHSQTNMSSRILRYGNPKPLPEYSSPSMEGGNRLSNVNGQQLYPCSGPSAGRLERHVSSFNRGQSALNHGTSWSNHSHVSSLGMQQSVNEANSQHVARYNDATTKWRP